MRTCTILAEARMLHRVASPNHPSEPASLRIAILGFLCGVLWLQSQAVLPDAHTLLGAGALLGVLAGWRQHALRPLPPAPVRTVLRAALAFCAAALLGAGYAGQRAEWRLADELPHDWESRDVDVEGWIASLPQRAAHGMRFEFVIDTVRTAGATLPRRVLLNWYGDTSEASPAANGRDAGTGPVVPGVAPGERWGLTVRLRRPHGTQNPHGFDFEAWALERGLRATGYVRPKGRQERLVGREHGLGPTIDRARLAIRQSMMSALGDRPYAGVLVALVIGQQNAIPAAQWRDFWRTGTGHLMSISGLHITMVASLVVWHAFRIWAAAPGLARRLPAQRAAALAGALAALAYSLVAGFSVPTQRTFYMLATVAVFLFFGRAVAGSRVLAVALLVVLLADPWAVLAPGFWLSFGALAAILYAVNLRTGRPAMGSTAIRTQAAVTLGLLPLTLALFQEVSLVSPLANAFAIPLVSWFVVPLALLGAALELWVGIDALLMLSHALMVVCHTGLAALAGLDQAVWQSHAAPPWAAALGVLAVAWLLAPRGIPGRWAAAMLLAPMFAVKPPAPGPGEFEVRLLDVGQGLAAVVRTASHALVFDSGPSWNPDADSGSRIVVPYLRGEGITRLTALIVSHADDDHSGGAASVIAARRPAWVMSSLTPGHAAVAGAGEHFRCEAGDAWHWDGVDFRILHPHAADYGREGIKRNNLSCVLKVSGPGGSILFTADVEKDAERALVDRAREDPQALRADVLVIPHHGSRSSSSEAFLDAVGARLALLPVGYRNRFRHPHAAVMERYAARRIPVYRTDELGALALSFRAGQTDGVRPQGFREERRRYWTDLPQRSTAQAEPQ
jgi:competence protein ComEC